MGFSHPANDQGDVGTSAAATLMRRESSLASVWSASTASGAEAAGVVRGKELSEPIGSFALLGDHGREDTLFCGGVVIAPSFLLTSAQCAGGALGYDPTHAFVGVVDTDARASSQRAQALEVAAVQTHPAFAGPTFGSPYAAFDVAVVRVAPRVAPPFDAKTAKVGDSKYWASLPSGTALLAVGMGYPRSSKLFKVDDLVYAPCDAGASTICARSEYSGGFFCEADEGGPLFHIDGAGNYVLLGLLSEPDCRAGGVSSFTAVFQPEVLDWVVRAVGHKEEHSAPEVDAQPGVPSSSTVSAWILDVQTTTKTTSAPTATATTSTGAAAQPRSAKAEVAGAAEPTFDAAEAPVGSTAASSRSLPAAQAERAPEARSAYFGWLARTLESAFNGTGAVAPPPAPAGEPGR